MIAEILPPVNEDSNKRPLTSGTKFKNSLSILLESLNQCSPHYVRCIKSNEKKQALTIDNERVRHQIRYLGLLENVRVRRGKKIFSIILFSIILFFLFYFYLFLFFYFFFLTPVIFFLQLVSVTDKSTRDF
jgi:hypothetical protein